MRNSNKSNHNSFLFFVTIILGLVLIIFNIFLDLSLIPEIDSEEENKQSVIWVLTIISKASSTVGLALILSNLTKLFNKKEEEEREIKRKEEIEGIIKNTVISKEFIRMYSDDEKKNIIAKLLTPDNSSLSRHSNIKEYLDAKSDKYLNFFNINFRSRMNIDIRVSKDKNSSRFKAEYTISYRIYKINKKYEPLCILSEKDHNNLKTVIQDCEGKILKTLELNDLKEDNGKYLYNIPEEYNDHNFLIVERYITEYGHSHWISLYWRSLTPIDGIDYKVNCTDGIIKENIIFDNEGLYNEPTISEDRKSLTIKSSQWLDPYTGISVIIADPSNDDFP